MSKLRKRLWRPAPWCALAVVVGLIVPAMPPPLYVNFTASVPPGIYWAEHQGAPVLGGLVLAEPPEPYKALATERGYLAAETLLLKYVSAVPGMTVCAHPEGIRIDDTLAQVPPLPSSDSHGRPLEPSAFCGPLPPEHYWLASSAHVVTGYDSRVFGPVSRALLHAQVKPLWTF